MNYVLGPPDTGSSTVRVLHTVDLHLLYTASENFLIKVCHSEYLLDYLFPVSYFH